MIREMRCKDPVIVESLGDFGYATEKASFIENIKELDYENHN